MIKTIATIADRQAMPISTITVAAPLGAAIGNIVIQWAGMQPASANEADNLPNSVTAIEMEKPAPAIQTTTMTAATESEIIAAAWALGAWDISRTAIPAGYQGPLPPHLGDLADAARESGYVTWMFKPILGGPELRAKANAAKDASLTPIMLGRSGPAPDITIPAITPGRQHLIRLGEPVEAKARLPRPCPRATRKQRWAIICMRRKLDEAGAPLPASLTRAEASAIIADLQRRLA
ncbi:MAG: hypothetical protein Q4G24_10530 [Paracoccus sp. (in: a-proteobacteria)]|uniref:hypothetical protein n=1 Tax=Paracoccus sp. TaxID=267 RepID=UPI0026DF7AD7|nr:hypothetical protein [Paracoccus sp. (in: a-proteobacteria)]MDO5621893.1 hypothetical protein [Paracoccus sp. (in: a-proteobacteria)]